MPSVEFCNAQLSVHSRPNKSLMQGKFSSTSGPTASVERKPKSISFDNTTLSQAPSTDQYVGSLSTEQRTGISTGNRTKSMGGVNTKRRPGVQGTIGPKDKGYASRRMKEYRARLKKERQEHIETIDALQRENQSLKLEIYELRKCITGQSVGRTYDPVRDQHC